MILKKIETWLSGKNAIWILALILVSHALLEWHTIPQKSATVDEPGHLTAGYSYWKTGDFRLNPEGGILAQLWATLPLLKQPLDFSRVLEGKGWPKSDNEEASVLFFHNSGNDIHSMLFPARRMMLVISLLLCVVVFLWSRQLFGTIGGIFSLVLCAFCPTVLAHGTLATPDLTSTLFFTTSLWSLSNLFRKITLPRMIFCGFSIGCLMVSKFSSIVLIPMIPLFVLIRSLIGQPLELDFMKRHFEVVEWHKRLAVLVLIFVLVAGMVYVLIWGAYGYRYSAFNSSAGGEAYLAPSHTGKVSFAAPWISRAQQYRILPQSFLHGLEFTLSSMETRKAFLKGQYNDTGWRSFFPYAFLVKTPPTLLALLICAAAALFHKLGRLPSHERKAFLAQILSKTFPIFIFLLLYWAIAIKSKINIGHRHILPTYPLYYVLAGGIAYWVRTNFLRTTKLLLCFLVLHPLEAGIIHPHYFSYFNVFAGGPSKGYRHLVDSSMDWGQDLPALKRFLEKLRPALPDQTPVYLAYFGTGNPDYYNLEATQITQNMFWQSWKYHPYEPGVYCISATVLQGVPLIYWGDWKPEYETLYRNLQELLFKNPSQNLSDYERMITLKIYDELRLSRLVSWLRKREPNAQVGYSIMIYFLTEQDLYQAQFAPLQPTSPSR